MRQKGLSSIERLYSGFTDDECIFFTPYIQQKTLAKGDYLLREGQQSNQIAFVEKGALRINQMAGRLIIIFLRE
ncbi:MAG: hypothetical protein MI975_07430 [Cytophagales bacterium]|nr:hypothetical protein [Cytophagales bacterium]